MTCCGNRRYHFRAESTSECNEWCAAITDAFVLAQRNTDKTKKWARWRAIVKAYYHSSFSQMIVASLILGNFAVSIVAAQVALSSGWPRCF